jgi:hypothetical protein
MPSGQISTGRAIPKIPGSREVRDSNMSIRGTNPPTCCSRRSASTSRPSRNGAASLVAAEIRRQRVYQNESTTRNPQNHAAIKSAGTR